MKKDLRKEISNLQEFSDLTAMLSNVYAEVLQIDKQKASKIITEKFNRHINIIADKIDKSVTEENLNILKNKKDVDIDEYLKEKPILKG
tara:strand:+ start:105 stop:371 length:267 start_codon:yes stop_codon:yes gene_type:complete